MEEKSIKKIILKGSAFVIGVFLLALCYNLFLLPNNYTFAGTSGLAIVIEETINFDATLFIYIANTTCLLISLIFLGWDKTKNTIVGSLLYPLMVTFSAPIAQYLLPHFEFQEMIITAACTAILYGISNGIIYKSGYTTGGNDVIMQLLNKYLKVPESQGLMFVNCFCILCGVWVFGLESGIYAFIIMIFGSYFIDRIMYGISDSKQFLIYTKHPQELRRVIIEEFKTGCTVLPTKGGYSDEESYLLMVVVTNRDYFSFKNKILEIDPDAFLVIDECYEVMGGVKRSNIPFVQ